MVRVISIINRRFRPSASEAGGQCRRLRAAEALPGPQPPRLRLLGSSQQALAAPGEALPRQQEGGAGGVRRPPAQDHHAHAAAGAGPADKVLEAPLRGREGRPGREFRGVNWGGARGACVPSRMSNPPPSPSIARGPQMRRRKNEIRAANATQKVAVQYGCGRPVDAQRTLSGRLVDA